VNNEKHMPSLNPLPEPKKGSFQRVWLVHRDISNGGFVNRGKPSSEVESRTERSETVERGQKGT